MYRTLYFRWVDSIFNARGMQVKSEIYYAIRYVSQKKFLELEGMLFDGALLLFSHQENASGVILAWIQVISRSSKHCFPGGSCQTVCWDIDSGWSRPRRSEVPKTVKVSAVVQFQQLQALLYCVTDRLYQMIPGDNVDKPLYLSTCLKWSSKDNSPVGHPRYASQ